MHIVYCLPVQDLPDVIAETVFGWDDEGGAGGGLVLTLTAPTSVQRARDQDRARRAPQTTPTGSKGKIHEYL